MFVWFSGTWCPGYAGWFSMLKLPFCVLDLHVNSVSIFIGLLMWEVAPVAPTVELHVPALNAYIFATQVHVNSGGKFCLQLTGPANIMHSGHTCHLCW